jgi:hypothetical protein
VAEPFEEEYARPFGYIEVDMEEKNLYNAWDSAMNTELPNFTTPSGYTTTAAQSSWINTCPEVLVFQAAP